MIYEDFVIAAVNKEGAAEFPDIRRGFYPARRPVVEIS